MHSTHLQACIPAFPKTADIEFMKLTGSVPTPIPAREPVSPKTKAKVSGKIFDLMMEGKTSSRNPQPAKDRLAEFLQNPVLAQYYYNWLNGK